MVVWQNKLNQGLKNLEVKFTNLKKGKEDIENYISWKMDLLNIDKTKDYFYHPIK